MTHTDLNHCDKDGSRTGHAGSPKQILHTFIWPLHDLDMTNTDLTHCDKDGSRTGHAGSPKQILHTFIWPLHDLD